MVRTGGLAVRSTMSVRNEAAAGGWAVVDVETTGLHPVRDRIVELAIIQLGPDAQVTNEWWTLVNPEAKAYGRLHGISAKDINAAPTFRELLDDVLARLADRVIVAHNAPFDVAFLQAETIRAGTAWGPVEGFCTMEVLHRLGIAKSRKLRVCCEELGIPAGVEHVALDDARAVAGLMAHLGPRLWTISRPTPAPEWQLPLIAAAVAHRSRMMAPGAVNAGEEQLARRVRVPSGLGITDAAASTYLGLLDHVVEDGVVTDSEVDALSLFARACGITRDTARQLHLAYLGEMSRIAQEDGIITEEERAHLVNLTALLGRALPH
jgi:DNA polymerase-3 subunit epsilon